VCEPMMIVEDRWNKEIEVSDTKLQDQYAISMQDSHVQALEPRIRRWMKSKSRYNTHGKKPTKKLSRYPNNTTDEERRSPGGGKWKNHAWCSISATVSFRDQGNQGYRKRTSRLLEQKHGSSRERMTFNAR
jgi:hypothetical protein